ncbi:MAG: NitT/TauT family transport system substrate-binding protein [Chloroflexota bacterium]|nr:NitT/TauT family transport system substrate-binding protein [Chloroflexota bacterium]
MVGIGLTGMRRRAAALTTLALILGACSGATPVATQNPASVPPVSGTPVATVAPTSSDPLAGKDVRLAFPSAPDFGNVDVPLLQAAFEARGAKFTATNYETQAQANNALLTGEADFQQTQLNSIVIANAVGADFRALFEVKANEWALVTPIDITTPEQLAGKRIGIHGPGTLTELLVNSTVKKYNLTTAQVMVVPGSDARAAALEAGQLDATPADVGTVLSIMNSNPGKYHVLINYSTDLPFLGSIEAVRKLKVDEDPAYIQAVVDVFTTVLRSMKTNPDQIDAAAASYLPDLPAEQVAGYKKAYLDMDYWNPTLTTERVQEAIQFMVDSGALAADKAPKPEDIADVSYFEKAPK